ncbi:MAG: hypothetical protein C4539_06535 [Ignavibacteriales bacterium]|nr:MAG: hypothetical protein C4539_06535 [Ignavibacteriales bacterium]
MKKILLFLVLLIPALKLTAQQVEDKAIAVIGNTSITTNEFKERYELTPHLGVLDDKSKYEFLYSLIAEKLWALKAKEIGYDTTAYVKSAMKILEKMYIRDALYKIEVKDKMVIPDIKIIQGHARANINLEIDFIVSSNEENIKNIHALLQKGYPFDSLIVGRDSVIQVSYGQLDETVEDSLYKLKPGEFTYPIKSPRKDENWFIFRVIKRVDALGKNSKQTDDVSSRVKKVVEQREEDRAYQNFYRKFFVGQKVNADGTVFWSLSEKIIGKIKEKKEKDKIADNEKIYLSETDFRDIQKEFGPDSLKVVFIKFEQDPVDLKDFLEDLAFESFFTTSTDSNAVRSKLNSRVRYFIERELVVREADKRGMQNLPEVKYYVDMWKNYYMSQLYKRSYIDSAKVSDDEVFNYYKSRNREITIPMQVNIVEVLTDSLEVIEKVLDLLKEGQDLGAVAKQYTKRVWTKEKNGEFGFFPVTMYGEIGKIASTMEIGEVYGPLKVPEGYSIFKLIDKKEETIQEPKPFEDVKDDVKNKLMANKLEDKVNAQTVKLAKEFGLKVDDGVFNALKVTNLAMIAYRYMGFGGRILGVPLTTPYGEWYELWQKSKKDLP